MPLTAIASSATRAMGARAAAVVGHDRVVTATRIPVDRCAAARRAVALVDHPRAEESRRTRRRRPAVTSTPATGIKRSAIPASGAPRTMPLIPDHAFATALDRRPGLRERRGSGRSRRPGSTTISTASASSIASSTLAQAARTLLPRTARTPPRRARRDGPSTWKCMSSSRPSRRRPMRVVNRVLRHRGSSRARTPKRAATRAALREPCSGWERFVRNRSWASRDPPGEPRRGPGRTGAAPPSPGRYRYRRPHPRSRSNASPSQ